MGEQNSQQDKDIEAVKTDIHWIKREIINVKSQVFNHIPTSIRELKKDFNDYKLSNSKWLIGILISIVFVFIGLIINLIFK